MSRRIIQESELSGLANTTSPYSPLNIPIGAVGVGFLYSLQVKQTAGNLDGFTVKVFMSGNAAIPNVATANNPGSTPAIEAMPYTASGTLDADIYRVIADITAASSASTASVFIPNGQPYANAHIPEARGMVSRLYLSIVPTTPAANKTFPVRMLTRGISSET